MSYEATGLMALFPVYLERAGREEDVEAVNSRIAQNENNLNQDLSILYNKSTAASPRTRTISTRIFRSCTTRCWSWKRLWRRKSKDRRRI